MNGNVAIVGLGLIGGSLARAIRKGYREASIYGVDASEETRKLSKALHLVDETYSSVLEVDFPLEQIDVLILATPVSVTCTILRELPIERLKEGVIISDTGSVKQVVLSAAERLTAHGVCFIGGHPMAGSHKSGVLASKEHLFENAYYLLITPHDKYREESLKTLIQWLAPTNAKIIRTTADKHDKLTALISHFPHMVASSLVHQVKNYAVTLPEVTTLAAGGFRDITRIASSNPIMWRDITVENRHVLQEQLTVWMEEMQTWRELLDSANAEAMEAYFLEAKEFRDHMPIFEESSEVPYFDLYIDVPDYPGVISEVTGYLAEERISLTNIRIMETRGDIYGILVVTFSSHKERERALVCLQANTNFEVIRST